MAQSPQMNRGIVKQVLLIVYVIVRLVKPFWCGVFALECHVLHRKISGHGIQSQLYTIKSNLSNFCFHTGSFRR